MTKLLMLLTIICFVLGCPVRRQSCNTTSSDLEINNVLSKETAYTYSMCSGISLIYSISMLACNTNLDTI